jgi:hypothetical protein
MNWKFLENIQIEKSPSISNYLWIELFFKVTNLYIMKIDNFVVEKNVNNHKQ